MKTAWAVLACSLVVVAYSVAVLLPLLSAATLSAPIATTLIGAAVATVTGIVALLKDPISAWITSPVLKIQFHPFDRRDCHSTVLTNKQTGAALGRAHYFRVRVVNAGRRTAEDVEVTLETVRQARNGSYSIDTDFMPLRLYWSHWRETRYEIPIPAGTYRHCDLGYVMQPSVPDSQENGMLLYWFDVFVRPNAGRVSLLPGKYRVTISASGRNVKGTSLTVEFDWRGTWFDDMQDMLTDSLIPGRGSSVTR